MKTNINEYGSVTCIKDISISVWDASGEWMSIKEGDVLAITYHEQDGSLGLTKDGVEVCCQRKERKCFNEEWDYEDE